MEQSLEIVGGPKLWEAIQQKEETEDKLLPEKIIHCDVFVLHGYY